MQIDNLAASSKKWPASTNKYTRKSTTVSEHADLLQRYGEQLRWKVAKLIPGSRENKQSYAVRLQ